MIKLIRKYLSTNGLVLIFLCISVTRKQELYQMGWADQVDLSKFMVAAAPYGGPIGEWKRYFTS